MRKLLLLLFLLIIGLQAYAQRVAVTGTVQSASDNTGLPGASVVLTKTGGTPVGQVTDAKGNFRFEQVSPGQYTLEVKYLGFKPFNKAIQVQQQALQLGVLKLQDESTAIKEVQVVGRAALGEQKGDTAQFNAKAFKTAPDASAEDMVQKMPGITIQNGTVQAQGEDVKQVLVDGKRFFGQDASTALRNLPADMIDNIQIFDKKSDQAELSGVDDGNREKTLNIVTRKDRREGQIGKVSAGYGTDDRYMVGASVNFFDNDRRITITGLTNNINMLDFSVGETPGGGMRGRRGWGGGSPNGIITTNTLGVNYSDMWGKKMEVSGNYLFNSREIINNQFIYQDYTSDENLGRTYTEERYNTNNEDNHRLNLRLDYKMNDNNRLLVTPNFTLQRTDNYATVFGQTRNDNGLLNQTDNNTDRNSTDFNLNNSIYFSHRFGKAGRTISTRLNTTYGNTAGDTYYKSDDVYYREDGDSTINFNRYTNLDRNRFSWSGNLTYTEPVSEHGQVEVEYNIGNDNNDSDNRTYDYSEQTDSYSAFNPLLSNTFQSEYLTQGVGTGYHYNSEKVRLELNARYQYARLHSDQSFPSDYTLSRTFTNVLPSAELEYKFSKSKNLRINYRTGTNPPSVSQLQDVVDYTNPLQLRTGNPDLAQEYENRLWMRYRNFNPENNHVFFAGVFGTFTQNYIGNSTFINQSQNETVTLDNGIALRPGVQLTRPANLDGYWNVRSFFNYGQPVNFISSNINAGGSIGYSRQPGLINGALNYANNTDFSVRLNLSSNISEKVDFNISSRTSYNIIQNTLQTNRNNNYFSQNTSLRYNWIFWKGLVYRTELNHQLNSGLSSNLDNNYLLWNMSISKKVFKNQKGEVSLSVNDLLKQNVSVQRNVTDIYVEDVQSSVLQRYFMLTFTYNIRNYTGKEPELDNQRGRWRPGGDH